MLTTDRPLRVAVLCSRRAPGLVHLLASDSARGTAFDIVAVVTSESTCPEAGLLEACRIPGIVHDIRAFYEARGSSVYRDFVTRRAYDRATVDLLTPFAPDLVLLDGYLYLVTKPMLEAYANRILNLHFSDLTIRRADHRPAYAGIRAVREALADGQVETSATLHLVNDEPDGGAPVVRSWHFPVSPLVARARQWHAMDMLKAYAFAHQEWMIREASGPVLSAALALIAAGTVDLDALGQVDAAYVTPWHVDARLRLTPPDSARMHSLLRGYSQATA